MPVQVRAWFVDPETGEKEWVDLDVRPEGESTDARPNMPRHCCLA